MTTEFEWQIESIAMREEEKEEEEEKEKTRLLFGKYGKLSGLVLCEWVIVQLQL